jgi:hypothetical protein
MEIASRFDRDVSFMFRGPQAKRDLLEYNRELIVKNYKRLSRNQMTHIQKCREIRLKLGCSQVQVIDALRKAGILKPRRQRNDEIIEMFKRLDAFGEYKRYEIIAKRVDLSAHGVRTIIRRNLKLQNTL